MHMMHRIIFVSTTSSLMSRRRRYRRRRYPKDECEQQVASKEEARQRGLQILRWRRQLCDEDYTYWDYHSRRRWRHSKEGIVSYQPPWPPWKTCSPLTLPFNKTFFGFWHFYSFWIINNQLLPSFTPVIYYTRGNRNWRTCYVSFYLKQVANSNF